MLQDFSPKSRGIEDLPRGRESRRRKNFLNYLPKGVDFAFKGAEGATMYFAPESSEQRQGDILGRLKKIEGQVRGLQGMVQDSRDCDQILAQVKSVQSALKSVTQLVLKNYLLKCYSDMGTEPRPAEIMQKLEKTVAILIKFVGD
jgi:DNA-binding FrmR family transcriptional regulator